MKGLIVVVMLIVAVWIGYNIRLIKEQRIQVQYPFPKENMVRITAYSPDPRQTDSTPFETASGLTVKEEDLIAERLVALSPDLIEKLKIRYGDILEVLVVMRFEFQDRTAKRWKDTLDVFVEKTLRAKWWGVKEGWIIGVERDLKRSLKKR